MEELEGAPDLEHILADEFPQIEGTHTDRRTLLRLMSASLAMAGLSACSEPATAPRYSRPRGSWTDTLGPRSTYASLLDRDGYGLGVVIETRNGRPIKIEGNPRHPGSLGATDVFGQAELLSFYDPDRSRSAVNDGVEVEPDSAAAMLKEMRNEFAPGGEGVRILTGPRTSPTMRALLAAMQRQYPAAHVHHYAAICEDNRRAGAVLAFGRPVETVYDFSEADVVLTLGADPFADMQGHVRHAADFAARRRGSGPLPRLYAAESTPGLTGARADRRIALSPADLVGFVRAVASDLGVAPGGLESHPLAGLAVRDLRQAGSRALVVAGRSQPAEVHAAAHAMNVALGAPGTTLHHVEPFAADDGGSMRSLTNLADDVAAGAVSHLLVLGANPAYDAPGDLGFAELIARVPRSVHLGLYRDETANACVWHLPRKHDLESWGDACAHDGTAGIRQPAAMSLPNCYSDEQALALVLGAHTHDDYEIVRSHWRDTLGPDFEAAWRTILAEGVVPDSAAASVTVELRPDWHVDWKPPGAGLAVQFAPDASVWDGRHANNSWLQELPHPLTKLVWDNAGLIAPATAMALGFESGDVVEIRAGDRSLQVPVSVAPGQAADTITLPLGYGRRAAGRVGTGVGFDANALRRAGSPWLETGVRIVPTGTRHDFVTTQDHHRLQGEDIVRVVEPGRPSQRAAPEPRKSFYPDREYAGHAWGMAIDLDACIGCNACVVACQAENNVPVVGREEVGRGREMHWLRIDRYYSGEVDDAMTLFQPVLCMHCEKAPCEVVCPVNATVHSSDGLNDMVYNRCIGTRTCSNNCPYKVRRFNWFDYFQDEAAPRNPDVSIRPRGVMEKCTYCVQRIRAAEASASVENRAIGPELQTACQQACPTRAIVFGDINDPESAVSQAKASLRNYALLGELDTRPRTTYLARMAAAEEPFE